MSNNRPTIADDLPRHIDAMAELTGRTTNWVWFDAQAEELDKQEARIKAGEKIPKEERVTKKDMYEAMGITPNTLDKYLTLRKIERVQQHGDK
jgi:predicted transcriptional regulator